MNELESAVEASEGLLEWLLYRADRSDMSPELLDAVERRVPSEGHLEHRRCRAVMPAAS